MAKKSKPKPQSKHPDKLQAQLQDNGRVENETVLVCGATGQQGGAVVNALISRGFKVRAVTRNLNSPAAKKLASKGVELYQGDYTDEYTIIKAATGVHAMYAVTTPFEEGVEAELEQGLNLIDAAIEAEVTHLILSSVASADKKTNIPHFQSKFGMENYLRKMAVPTGLNFTISAPVYFMENLISPWLIGPLKEGLFTQAMPEKRPLQQVALRDLGAFVAELISRGKSVYGKRFEVASDAITGLDEASTLTRVIGRKINYKGFSPDIMREQSADMAAMYEWFDRIGYNVDIKKLHKEFSEVNWHGFEDWANEQDWEGLLSSDENSNKTGQKAAN